MNSGLMPGNLFIGIFPLIMSIVDGPRGELCYLLVVDEFVLLLFISASLLVNDVLRDEVFLPLIQHVVLHGYHL